MQTSTPLRRCLGALALVLGVILSACTREPVEVIAQAEDQAAAQGDQRPPDPYAARRKALVDKLRRDGIEDEKVLKVMLETPRHKFVPTDQVAFAYEDHPLPIGEGQTISQPFIVAFMTWKLDPKPEDVVLEIGTGSGYQAAILSPLVKHVYTIEILESLGKSAEKRLKEMEYENITVRVGDGYKGWPEHAPFDRIIVTCAPNEPPQPLVDQLKEGGKMVIPYGGGWGQKLYILEKRDGRIEERDVLDVLFVPMTGEAQEH